MPDIEQKKKRKSISPNLDQWGNPVWTEEPEYRDEEGNINPEYKSSRLESVGAGARYGLSLRTGNSMFDMGAALGGMVGGLFNKNLAGREKYQKDVAEVARINETTQAHQRFLAQQELMEQRKQKAMRDQSLATVREQAAKAKSANERAKLYESAAKNSGDPELRKFFHQQYNMTLGLEDEPNEYFGLGDVSYNSEEHGDSLFIFNKKTGELIKAKNKDGSEIDIFSTPEKIRALKDWVGLTDNDTGDIQEALQQANQYIAQKGLLSGGLKPQQANSLRMQLARLILQNNKKKGSTDGTVIIGGKEYGFGDLPMLGQPNKPVEPTNDIQNDTPPPQNAALYDGLSSDAMLSVSGIKTAEEGRSRLGTLPNTNTKEGREFHRALQIRIKELEDQKPIVKPPLAEDEPIKVNSEPANSFKTVQDIPVNQEIPTTALPLTGMDEYFNSVDAQISKTKGLEKAAWIKLTIDGVSFKYNRKTKKLVRVK